MAPMPPATPWTINVHDILERVLWTFVQTWGGLVGFNETAELLWPAMADQVSIPSLYQLGAAFMASAISVLKNVAKQRLEQLDAKGT